MSLSGSTKIDDLLREYPFLEEHLVGKSPRYQGLRNPMMRATVGKMATLERVARIGGFEPEAFLSDLEAAIRSHAQASTAERQPDRVEALRDLLLELHRGADPKAIQERVEPLLAGLDPTQIVRIGQSLVDAGVPETEVKRLSDIHSELFRKELETAPLPQVPAGHPVNTYMLENRAAEEILDELEALLATLGDVPDPKQFDALREHLLDAVTRLSDINAHYRRKENQLFPILEARDLPGPPQVMWAVHDEIRGLLSKAGAGLWAGSAEEAPSALRTLAASVREMIYKEERILFPMCLEAFTEEDWAKAQAGEAEIGFAWIQPEPAEDLAPTPPGPAAAAQGLLRLTTGELTAELVDLVLNALPLELTFVDDNDEVAYYSHGAERVFPRSPGIIGRRVHRCHPPQSVAKVERILEAFRAGRRDSAEFWLRMQGRFIHIRYFAVRDKAGTYRGTLEVAQDVTGIRALQGERRLLDEE